jgi:hypothetical protein
MAGNIAAIVTAVATSVLAIGVWIAARQLAVTRKFNKIIETDHLVREFDDANLLDAFKRLEKFDGIDTYLDTTRERANKVYGRIHDRRGIKRYRSLWEHLDSTIQKMAGLTDRIEIYIRSGNADESVIAEHVGYYIVVSYYALKDILQQRTIEEDFTYESYRDLARRIQDYGKLHPLEAELRENLCWADLPPLVDATGVQSISYLPRWAIWRKFKIWRAERKRKKGKWWPQPRPTA